MEFTSYHYNLNKFVAFIKHFDLIRIYYNNMTITIFFEELKTQKLLYGYYLLSKILTPDLTKVIYENDNNIWYTQSYVHTNSIEFSLEKRYCAYDINPLTFTLIKSSPERYKKFKFDLKKNPYDIINKFIKYKKNIKIDNEITLASMLFSGFKICK